MCQTIESKEPLKIALIKTLTTKQWFTMLLNEIHNNRIQRLIEILLDRQEQHDSANNVQTNVQELLDEDIFERDN